MDLTDVVAGGRQRVVGFADVVRIPLQRRRTVLMVTALVSLAVSSFLLFVPATYTATSVVVLRPVVTDPFTLPSGGADRAINMTAENGIAGGNAVIDKTSQVINRSPDDVRDALSIEIPIGGQVLRFSFDSTDEQLAVKGANAAAGTYLQVRENIYKEQRASLLLSYDSTIKQVSNQRKAAQKELPGGATSSPRTEAVLDQVRALNDQVAQLANQRAKIASADLSPGAVTAEARTPTPSSHDAALLYLLGGLLGGLLLGMIAAHAREAFDRRIRSAEQAAELSGLSALGVVRAARRRGGDATADADARYVALAVQRELDLHSDRPLVVVSSRADEGRTTVAGNLAVAMAEAGHDVFLAAAPDSHDELRRILFAAQRRSPPTPRVNGSSYGSPVSAGEPLNGIPGWQRTAAVGGSAGLTSAAGVLQVPGTDSGGLVTEPRSEHRAQDPDATVVMSLRQPQSAPAGAGGPAEPSLDRRPLVVLLGIGAVRLGSLNEPAPTGVVVVDAPPSDTDERGVRAAQSGVALLVVARDRTRNTELTRLVDRLRSAGAQTVGFVLTGGRSA